MKQVELEIQKLSTVRHPKLITIFAVKLHIPHSSGPPQLMVLSEQLPALTLHDVLEESEFLREERVSVSFFFLGGGVFFFIFGFLTLLLFLGIPRSDFDSSECDSHKRLRSQRYVFSSWSFTSLYLMGSRYQQGSTHDVLD